MIGEKVVVVGSTPKETLNDLNHSSGDVCLIVGDDAGSLSVFDQLAICNAIKQRGHRTVVELRGVACPLIAMGADRVIMDHKSMLIVKGPFMPGGAAAAAGTDAVDLLEKTKAAMKDCYALRPHIEKESIFAMLDDGEDHFIDATEARRLGVIDQLC